MWSIFTPKKKLFSHIIEAVIGLSFASGVIYFIAILNGTPIDIGLIADKIQSSIVMFLESNFNKTYVPHLSIFTSLWAIISVVLLLMICAILLHNFLKHKNAKHNTERQSKYQDFFANVVSDNSDQISTRYNLENKRILKQHLSKDDFTGEENRQALLKELKAMYEIISGNQKDKLRDLYFGLGFVDELEQKFTDSSWNKRVEAIQEAKQFNVSKFYPNIFKLVNDPKELVRRHALIARVDLDDEPLSLLGDIDYTLSVWERHKILNSLIKLPSYKLPNFAALYNDFPLHIDFLQELSEYFHQNDFATVIRMA